MPRPVITLLALTLCLLTAGATAADKPKKPTPPPRKAAQQKPPQPKAGAKPKQAAPAKRKAAPSRPMAKPGRDKRKHKTVTAHQATLDLARGAVSQTGGAVLISKPGTKVQPVPAGQLVQLFFKKHDKGSKPAKLAEARTAANGRVTFHYKVPANVAPGVYRIWAKYPGGNRWQPSESGPDFVNVK